MFGTSQLEKAVQHFQTAIRLVPTYRGAYFNLAHGLIRTEKHSEAELILRAARKRFPDDPQLADLLSDVLMAQGRWKDSAVLFGEILGRFGQSYSRLINVGVAFSRLGKDANAEDAWRLAVALDPKQHHGSYNLIWLFLRTGRHDEAKNVYDAAMLKLPRSETETSEVEAIFANSLMQQGRFVEGEALLRERIARGHADASVFSTLSVLLGDYLGRYREAAEVCEVGLEAHPDVWRLGNSLAYALLMAGEIERANSVLQRYTRHVGVDPYFTATRGLYFLRRGYQERGVALYRKAVALAPSAHKARIRQKLELELGRWFFDGGDVKLAKPHLKRAVDLGVDKSFTLQARELLARL
jgi:tetratricopeptide (TPR) repeat protein